MSRVTTQYKFWISQRHGLIRQSQGQPSNRPEVWHETGWVPGSPYVTDAISGMGEDFWSCGEWADECDQALAEQYANEHGIDLYSSSLKD